MSAHGDLLQRLLVGELDPDSDEAREFFMRNPEERARFEALRDVERRIGQAAADRASDVEAALEERAAPGEELVAHLVERHFAERAERAEGVGRGESTDRPSAGPRARWWLPLVALAASVLLLWRPWTGSTPGPVPDPGPLLGGELRLLQPVGAVDEFDEFRWEYDLEGTQYFRVEVIDPEDPFGEPLASEEPTEPLWRPDADEIERWPDALEWRVDVMETGAAVDSAFAEAWRR